MRLWNLIHYWWDCKMVQPLWKTVWQFLKKLKIELPDNPEILFLGTYPRELRTCLHKNLYSNSRSVIIHKNQTVEAA